MKDIDTFINNRTNKIRVLRLENYQTQKKLR